jgi:hypothetical protein
MVIQANLSRKLRLGASAIAVCGGLAGCAGEPVVSTTWYDPGYAPTEYRASGMMPVVVRGNPYAVPKAELDQAVTDAMQGTANGTATRFAPAAAGVVETYRVVMLFNPGLAYGATLCTRPEPPDGAFGVAPSARVPVSAALCRGDKSISYADGYISTGSGPQGAEFQRGVSRFSMALFPPYIWDRGGGSDSRHSI